MRFRRRKAIQGLARLKPLPPRPIPWTAEWQFPHCDQRILHAPGECRYCDEHPEWQALRRAWGINFTGHDEPGTITLCPADIARPAGSSNDHRLWGGNAAEPYAQGGIIQPGQTYVVGE